MSVSDSSSILAGVDAGLAIALFAALLLPRVRTAMFPVIVAAIAASAGLVGGLYLSQAQGGPPPSNGAPPLPPSPPRSPPGTPLTPSTPPSPPEFLLSVEPNPPVIPHGRFCDSPNGQACISLRFKNSGTEKVNITAGDVWFCPTTSTENCKRGLSNRTCKPSLVCSGKGFAIDPGRDSIWKWATITYPSSPFYVRVKLSVTDSHGDHREEKELKIDQQITQIPSMPNKHNSFSSRANHTRGGRRYRAQG